MTAQPLSFPAERKSPEGDVSRATARGRSLRLDSHLRPPVSFPAGARILSFFQHGDIVPDMSQRDVKLCKTVERKLRAWGPTERAALRLKLERGSGGVAGKPIARNLWHSGGRVRRRPTFFRTRSRGCTWVAVRTLCPGRRSIWIRHKRPMHDDLRIAMEAAAPIRPRDRDSFPARRRLASIIADTVQAASSWLGSEGWHRSANFGGKTQIIGAQ